MKNLSIYLTLISAWMIATSVAKGPNMIVIIVDDMGYSDIGCFGSEISTPHIDQMAKEGLVFTNFTNAAKCTPSRTSLMTGLYMSEQNKKPFITIPQALSHYGYDSYAVGKWHIAIKEPLGMGFKKFYGFLPGATNFFTVQAANRGESVLQENETMLTPDEDFYCTTAFTDKAIEYIYQRNKEKPFFLYLAYNAPHYPLQAPKEEVMKYRGKYKEGWTKLRTQRFAGLKAKGIIPKDAKLSDSEIQTEPISKRENLDWDTLTDEQKDFQDLRMATYAAMIDMVDQDIGRLIAKLKSEAIYENTCIIFLSDNGACPFERTHTETRKNKYMPWDPRSFYCYNEAWANACNTPWRRYKQNQHEGGIATPVIVHWPVGVKNPGRVDSERAHITDIHPTLFELAGGEQPQTFEANEIPPTRGISFAPTIFNREREKHKEIYYRYSQYSALWQSGMKLVNNEKLYDIRLDRIEENDLSQKFPERFEAMKKRWLELDQNIRGKKKGKSSDKTKKKKNDAQ
ncbi:MAG: arylsulfatase [Verrucomicrobiota bacterium]